VRSTELFDSRRDGFRPDDPVSILGRLEPLLPTLLQPDGRWLVPDIEPYSVPEFEPEPGLAIVVDSGVRRDHPSLKGRIAGELDLTGEGSEDLHGHGTAVAAILAASSPWLQLYSIKALRRTGHGDVATLAHAFREAARVAGDERRVVNVSAGRRTPDCSNDCPLCATVLQLQDRPHPLVFVCASGNTPGVAYCPARVSIAISTPAPWDADGDIDGHPPGWTLST